MKVSVIIPAVNENLVNELLFSIRLNTHIPNNILIINNTPTGRLKLIVPDLPLTTYISGNFMGTNECWRRGIATLPKDTDIVCILNDDLYLNPLFFKKLISAVEKTDNSCSVLVPAIKSFPELKRVSMGLNNLRCAAKRSGYAMCMKKSFLDAAPVIPKPLKIFYGDDWYFQISKTMGLHWVEMVDNPVFHYVGFTASQNLRETRKQREIEKHIFKKEFQKWLSHRPTVQI